MSFIETVNSQCGGGHHQLTMAADKVQFHDAKQNFGFTNHRYRDK